MYKEYDIISGRIIYSLQLLEFIEDHEFCPMQIVIENCIQ